MHTKGGFTLVELLVVIVVISILAAITTTTYVGLQDRAKSTVALTSVDHWIDAIQIRLASASPPREGTTFYSSCLGASEDIFPARDGFVLGSCIDILSGNTSWDDAVDQMLHWYSPEFYTVNDWWSEKQGMFEGSIPTSVLNHSNGVKFRMRGVIAYTVPKGYVVGPGNTTVSSNPGEPYVRLYWIVSPSGVSCGKGKEDTAWSAAILALVGKNAPVTSGKVCQYTMTY